MSEVRNAAGLVLDDREEGIFRVHRSALVDKDIFELERRLIFDKSWLFAGHVSEFPKPGDFVSRNVGGRPLILVNGDDGQIRALLNTCRHRGNLVCREPKGSGAEVFRCFYHGWIFNTRGELKGIPGEAAYSDAFDREALGLEPTPRMHNHRGCIFISYDPDIESFEDYMSDALKILDNTLDQGDMEFIDGQYKYSMRANWKLLVENSYDGFHAIPTHETYFDYLTKHIGPDHVAKAKANISTPGASRALDFGNGHAAIESIAGWGRPIARSIPPWGEEGKAKAEALMKELEARVGPERAVRIGDRDRNIGIFPNLVLNDIMAITVRTFYPIAPNLMEVNSWALAPVGEDPVTRKHRLDNFLEFLGPGGFATPDDVEALESAQRGYASSRFSPWNDISRGVLKEQPAADDEAQMRSFWRQWDRLMRGAE